MIIQHVKPGSIIVTDCWKSYTNVPDFGEYFHFTVNHSKNFKNLETQYHTNRIEGTWSGIKNKIPNRNKTNEFISYKLLEFIWRRKNEGNVWSAFIESMRIAHVEDL